VVDEIRADFDRIARLSTRERWDHNNHYHRYLLKHAPRRCELALDIGCGAGEFTRLLAARSHRVLALDLSPEMIRIARQCSAGCTNIDYRVADVMQCALEEGAYDCIASIATWHPLPFAEIARKVRRAIRPGGGLLVLDLFQGSRADRVMSALAVPVNIGMRLVRGQGLRVPAEIRAAWETHGRHDTYLTFAEVRRLCAAELPGAIIRRHFFWRYSLVWRKPAGDAG
jgi:2-polyprenyl-3-methyl-5-hydroxy-6-metoxy-1,4-benzoquinol methylase